MPLRPSSSLSTQQRSPSSGMLREESTPHGSPYGGGQLQRWLQRDAMKLRQQCLLSTSAMACAAEDVRAESLRRQRSSEWRLPPRPKQRPFSPLFDNVAFVLYLLVGLHGKLGSSDALPINCNRNAMAPAGSPSSRRADGGQAAAIGLQRQRSSELHPLSQRSPFSGKLRADSTPHGSPYGGGQLQRWLQRDAMKLRQQCLLSTSAVACAAEDVQAESLRRQRSSEWRLPPRPKQRPFSPLFDVIGQGAAASFGVSAESFDGVLSSVRPTTVVDEGGFLFSAR
nr:hypothetical protein Iba_chr02fCG9110 [Ipomoea batatas]